MKFRTLLLGHHDDHSIARISDALDRMDHNNRLFTVLSITAEEQKQLWELMEGREVDAEHFVPSGTEPLKEVIHHGKNTLPAHNFFQKRFCVVNEESGQIGGYNHQSLSWATGPGYYVAHSTEGEKEPPAGFVIDYTQLPANKPESWPPIKENKGLLAGPVYGGMHDYMRGVSSHVSIGRAYKGGKAMDAWFILCREDPEEDA